MSLSPGGRCVQCGLVTSYVNGAGTFFVSQDDHSTVDCAKKMKNDIYDLQMANRDLNKELAELRQAPLVLAPQDQKEKLIDQCQRWQAMFERERYRRWALKKEIMKVYGTLDFRVETGAIVDVNAKSVAEYVSVKLRELIRRSER